MKKLIIFLMCASVCLADTKTSDLVETTDVADTDVMYLVDGGVSKKITVLNLFDTIDTFAELNTICADATLVSEEGTPTLDALWTFGLGLTITTGDPLTLGVVRWDDGSDQIDGEQIADNTIDVDSLDWGAFTDLGEAGVVTWTNMTEGELTDQVIVSGDIKEGTILVGDMAANSIDSDQYVDDSIDNAHINWADIDNLGDEGAVSLSTLATTLTITDNEDTAENNPIVFVAGGDLDGGNLGLESDGTCYYTPSTGTITTTEFVGGGAGLTAVAAATGDSATDFFDEGEIADARISDTLTSSTCTGNAATVTNATFTTALTVDTGTLTLTADVANNSVLTIGAGAVSVSGTNTGDNTDAETGDSATAFFDAGTIEHEWGGLQADVSGYTGLIGITGADTTAEVDALSELLTAMEDVTAFITDDDMPAAGADPDVDAAGEIGRDTDAANETGDSSLRGYDGANQFLYSRKLKTLNFTLISPDTIDAADLIPIWHNTTGMTFTITEIKAWSDDDDVNLEVEELTDQTDYTARTLCDTVVIETDGTGVYLDEGHAASDHAAIEHDHSIAIDFDTNDTPDYVQMSITGWFNSDVD